MSTRWKRLFWLGLIVGSSVPFAAGLLAWGFVAAKGRVPINLFTGAAQLIPAGFVFSIESVVLIAFFALLVGAFREENMPVPIARSVGTSDQRWFSVCSGFVVMTLSNVALVFLILIDEKRHPMYSAIDALNLALFLVPHYFALWALAAILIGSGVGHWVHPLLHKRG